MAEFETRVRVRYAETDQMGVVYHANYLVWMEVARTDYCSHIGVDYRVMEQEDGCVVAVVDAHVRYVFPARFGDEIIVGVHTLETSSKMLKFAYEMRRVSDDRRIATGDTTHLYLSKDDFRPIRLPQKYRAAFRVKESAE